MGGEGGGFEAGVTFPVAVYGPVPVGPVELAEGPHRLRFKVIGVNRGVATSDRFLYFDGVAIQPLPRRQHTGG